MIAVLLRMNLTEIFKTPNNKESFFYFFFNLFINQSLIKECSHNGLIITWILHQNIMYSNKVKPVAG